MRTLSLKISRALLVAGLKNLTRLTVALGVLALLMISLPAPAQAGPPIFVKGDPQSVTATTSAAFARSTSISAICSVTFINPNATKLHVGFYNGTIPDAGVVTTTNSGTVCSAAGSCTWTDWVSFPAANGAMAFRAAAGSMSIVILYGACSP